MSVLATHSLAVITITQLLYQGISAQVLNWGDNIHHGRLTEWVEFGELLRQLPNLALVQSERSMPHTP